MRGLKLNRLKMRWLKSNTLKKKEMAEIKYAKKRDG